MRFKRNLIFLLFTLLIAGCGGGGGGGGSSNTANVTGIVEDSANSDAGLSGATISIGGVSATTTTSANASSSNPVGSFTINGAQVGATTAKITVAGAAASTAQTVAFSPALANGSNAPLTLFINIGEISGTLLLPDGTPAANAFVSVASNGEFVQSNSDGTFLLINVPVGATTLTAVLGTASLNQAVTVANGLTALGNLKLVASTNTNPPTQPYTISGQVLDGGSTPATDAVGAEVFLLSNGQQLETVNTDSNGDYSFYVPVGTYQLKFQQNEFQTTTENITVSNPSTPTVAPTVTLTPQS